MAAKPKSAEDKLLNKIGEQTDDPELIDNSAEEGDHTPTYQMVGDSRIPVSKTRGKLWKQRRDQAKAKLQKAGDTDAWDEAIRYYKNDQSRVRSPRYTEARGSDSDQRLNTTGSSTENIVFANVTALVPATYAKNPDCEITPEDKEDETLGTWCTVAQRLVNALAAQKAAPGYNLKPKVKKAITNCMLTNLAYVEVGYTFKEQSSEQALSDLRKLATKLAEAKDINEQREIEGQLQALEDVIDILRPAGPWVKFRRPYDVLRDPDSVEEDMTDARWIMVHDMINTNFLKAKYGKRNEDGSFDSIYKPSHVLAASADNSAEEEINSFSLLGTDPDFKSMGFSDQQSFDKAQVTECWWIWDKVTQRVELYNNDNWKWPIWVWDDPYHLDTFFTVFPLYFYVDPDYTTARGEVSYYLDQQDEINDMNDLIVKARKWARGNIFYNKNIIKDGTIIDRFLEGGSEARAVGIDLPPEADITKVIHSIVPPALEYEKLFNKDNVLQGVDRVSSVSSAMRGVEYKTNTTNKAIEAYSSQDQTRLDEKTDAIEDWIGDIQWAVLQLCAQFMPQEQVSSILGSRMSAGWKPMTPQDIRAMVDIRVVGGSSLKPTSSAKKKEAMQMVQTMGQFAKAGAGASIIIALKVLQRAFDDVTITKEDWNFLQQSIQSELQRGAASGPGAGPANAGGPPATPQQPAGAAGQQQGAAIPAQEIAQVLSQATQAINALPPQMKLGLSKALGTALAKGVPIEEALPRIVQMLMGGEEQQQPQAQQPAAA